MNEILHTGDNLDFMKSLQSESIDLIYGDILYGTGRNFTDYQDIKSDRKTVENFYIPRIAEMHRLLRPTGSIYLQMDTRINHYVRLILEDIFGYQNFRNEIVWQRRSNANNVIKNNGFHNNYDIILFFSKSKNFYFENQYKPLSSEGVKRYNNTDDKGSYQYSELKHKSTNSFHSLIFEGKEYSNYYIWTQKKLDAFIANGGEIKVNSKGDLCYKMYLHNSKGSYVADIWTDLIYENAYGLMNDTYKTHKSIKLMTRIIKASSKEGDVCADFFSGSGSFGVASKKLNRNIILCDINPKAIELSKKRLLLENNLFNSISN